MTTTLKVSVPNRADHFAQRVTVAAAGNDSIFRVPARATIGIEPGAGGTMAVKVRVTADSPLVDLDPDSASFSAAATRVIMGPVWEIQFQATTAAGAGSVMW